MFYRLKIKTTDIKEDFIARRYEEGNDREINCIPPFRHRDGNLPTIN